MLCAIVSLVLSSCGDASNAPKSTVDSTKTAVHVDSAATMTPTVTTTDTTKHK